MRRSWAEIDLGVLEENIRAVRGVLCPETEIIFVVKANAYGHGAIPVCERASLAGIRWFGVAYVQEAMELRRRLSDPNILILGAAEPRDVQILFDHRLTPVVVSVEHARLLGDEALALGRRLPVHVKVDTGLGRLGIPWDEAESACPILARHAGLDVRGLCSHFATAEPDDARSAQEQIERFRAFDAVREAIDPKPVLKHISSSRATLHFAEWEFDAVRLGISLYGYGAEGDRVRAHTRPILQWKACVMQVKPVPAGTAVGYYGTYVTPEATQLAILSVGYAEGFLRTLSNRAIVLIGGKRCKVVGRVSMNWLTVDIGPEAAVQAGDEVVLIGRQGDEEIWAGELARLCRTIPYEILTNIKAQVERRYVG